MIPRLARVTLLPLALTSAFHSHAVHAAEAALSVSPTLIVSYCVKPANRAAFRSELEREQSHRLQHWKDEHVLKSYRLLFNRYADSDNWDAMVVLSFAGPAELARWQSIEKSHPAGLSRKALALTTAIHTTPVQLVRNDTAKDSTANPVFVVIPYATLVSASDYLKYADGYVIPQFEGWMREGVLAHYGLYVSTFPAGRPWTTMAILEYRDDQALAARDAVVTKVRDQLKDVPEWKAISDNKKQVRDEKQVVVADAIAAPE